MIASSKSIHSVCDKVHILERLRDEQKFESFEALKLQLEVDKQNTIHFFENLK